ncbi:hypothetical protein TMatcc_010180 [Talaromyces marneffei ATCC 18224]
MARRLGSRQSQDPTNSLQPVLMSDFKDTPENTQDTPSANAIYILKETQHSDRLWFPLEIRVMAYM